MEAKTKFYYKQLKTEFFGYYAYKKIANVTDNLLFCVASSISLIGCNTRIVWYFIFLLIVLFLYDPAFMKYNLCTCLFLRYMLNEISLIHIFLSWVVRYGFIKIDSRIRTLFLQKTEQKLLDFDDISDMWHICFSPRKCNSNYEYIFEYHGIEFSLNNEHIMQRIEDAFDGFVSDRERNQLVTSILNFMERYELQKFETAATLYYINTLKYENLF